MPVRSKPQKKLYQPAKSTKFMLLLFFVSCPDSFLLIWSNMMVTTVWARELVAFICVAATVRLAVPEIQRKQLVNPLSLVFTRDASTSARTNACIRQLCQLKTNVNKHKRKKREKFWSLCSHLCLCLCLCWDPFNKINTSCSAWVCTYACDWKPGSS